MNRSRLLAIVAWIVRCFVPSDGPVGLKDAARPMGPRPKVPGVGPKTIGDA